MTERPRFLPVKLRQPACFIGQGGRGWLGRRALRRLRRLKQILGIDTHFGERFGTGEAVAGELEDSIAIHHQRVQRDGGGKSLPQGH